MQNVIKNICKIIYKIFNKYNRIKGLYMTKFIRLGWLIFVVSCTMNTQSQNNEVCDCDVIYGHKQDWEIISDDLARNIYAHNLKCKENN